MRLLFATVLCLALAACISPDNETVEGTGTPDIPVCGTIPGAGDGADYRPLEPRTFAADGRVHPDLFYLAWSTLDSRSDLRFPARGYEGTGFEDKLMVSREEPDGSISTWQLLPKLNDSCQDVEKIRLHSFDVAPDGKTLYLSMRRDSDPHLAIYAFDVNAYSFEKLAGQAGADLINPTYVGDDPQSGHPILFVAKTVEKEEIPVNYFAGVLRDEYDRAPTPLIHRLDAVTGDLFRIGLNNSHQTEPVAIPGPDGTPLVVFTQWEHQQTVNRFALWKMQVDGSDNFTFYGQESRTDRSGANLFSPRAIRSGPYQGYVLMTEGARSNHSFAAEGDILMTLRADLDLRSAPLFLSRVDNSTGDDVRIARSPEHYNAESFVYAHRETVDNTYSLYVKDYPAAPDQSVVGNGPGTLIIADPHYHFVQPRSFYPPPSAQAAPGEGDLGESRSSFTNPALDGKSGFLVQNLTESDNGVQHQLDGIAPDDIALQFFIPSHTFDDSSTVGVGNSPEMSIPASGFIRPESDGSLGVIVKSGLYVWKVNKRFNLQGQDVWIPVRAERQEVSFVPNRVNACNQCHQERSQENIDHYAHFESIAATKMKSADLSAVPDITSYNAYAAVPDFHRDIMPLFTTPGRQGQSCADCHNARDKLNLSNPTGPEARNATWRTLVSGAHRLPSGRVVPYVSSSINPLGMDDDYQPAPFLWSLLLNDDLTVPPEAGFPNNGSRVLVRPGDYGATYDAEVEQAIAEVNAAYDHSAHWSAAQVQQFITYATTQVPVGLSDRIDFQAQGADYLGSAAGQKAYQALVRNCFECHNNHIEGGIDGDGFGLPQEKRFAGDTDLKSRQLRFVIWSHLAQKGDTTYSPYPWQSDLETAMYRTLESARYRIDFANPSESELLVYARADQLHDNVQHPAVLSEAHPDYLALSEWINGGAAINQPPTLAEPLSPLTFAEYDEPAWSTPLAWSDPDGDYPVGDLSQLMLLGSGSAAHTANDSMLALDYLSLNSARVKTYAILGDRGTHQFDVRVTDGQQGTTAQSLPVTITSDYIVPTPRADLPTAYAFYTVRASGELRRIDSDGTDRSVGFIDGYTTDFTTVYRRADQGWLYFFDQGRQRVHVVDERDASVRFTIQLDHQPNKETATHKQTVYLLWWRPADGLSAASACAGGELQAVLESKLSETRNGDFYVGLGCGEPPLSGDTMAVVPEYRTRLPDGGNTIGVYVWRRATFMTHWANESIDRLNVLNLVTGKPKFLTDYAFQERVYQDTLYPARDYHNVRAVVVGADGAFYGFNKDPDRPVEMFNFDPLEGVQMPVALPAWLQAYLESPLLYGTPFLVIEPRSAP